MKRSNAPQNVEAPVETKRSMGMSSLSLNLPLRHLALRLFLLAAALAALWMVLALLAVLLAGAGFDLAVEMSAAMRRSAGGLALGAALATGMAILWPLRRQLRAAHLARRLDHSAGTSGQIALGVDLASSEETRSPLSTSLANLAVERAATLAAAVSPSTAAPARPLRLPATILAGLLFCMVIGALFAPRLVWTQCVRFLDPYGDHPAYSVLQLNVEPGNAVVSYGDDITILATATGAPVESLEFIAWENKQPINPNPNVERNLAEKSEALVLPMFRQSDGKWQVTLVNVTESAEYFVRARRARTPRHAIAVVTRPRVRDVRVRMTAPAYTRREPIETPLKTEGLRVQRGTKVEIWASSNRPLVGGSLTFFRANQQPKKNPPDQTVVTLRTSDENQVQGEFVVTESGRLELRVRGVDGQESETLSYSVQAHPDAAPLVRLLNPREYSFATPDIALPVVISAEDDQGIARLQLFQTVKGKPLAPVAIPLDPPEAARFEAARDIPLAPLQLQPGDELQLFARVTDNDPAGGKSAETPVATVIIISQAEFDRFTRVQQGVELMRAKYLQAERRLEARAEDMQRLQKKLRDQPGDAPVKPEDRDELRRLTRRLREDAQALREAMNEVLPYDLDNKLAEELDPLAQELDQWARNLEEQARKPDANNQNTEKSLAEALKKLAEQRQQFQQDASEPMENFAKIYPLMEDEARFAQLAQQQRDLERRIHHAAQETGVRPAAWRQHEEEQRNLREQLRQLEQDLADHVAALPEEPKFDDLRQSAQQFLEEMRQSEAAPAMAQCETALNESTPERAHPQAQRAAEALEKMLDSCCGKQGMGQQCKSCMKFQPKLQQSLGQTVEQMLNEAGLKGGKKPGQGQSRGIGAGSGPSSHRSSLSNIGMYGRQPSTSTTSAGGGGKKENLATGSVLESATAPPQQPGQAVTGRGTLQASGSGAALVPPRYRERVSAYFQRLAEELPTSRPRN